MDENGYREHDEYTAQTAFNPPETEAAPAPIIAREASEEGMREIPEEASAEASTAQSNYAAPGDATQTGEYSYSREEIPRRSYIDATFQCGSEMERPRSYYTPPQKLEKKKKKKGGMGRFVAACLICAVLGGVGGGAIVATLAPKASAPSASYGGSGLNVNSGEGTRTPPTSVSYTGERLTGSQIYALGCEQAVGITTEITYRNYFGMESSMAVSGSGFIVTDDGYIVTNYHVIQTAYEGGYDISVVLHNGEPYTAQIVGFEKDNDMAVLKINVTDLPAATLGDSDNLLVGDAVYAIGNPLGELNFSMSTGTVSALDRQISTTDSKTGKAVTNNMFQVDAAVNEGNSGGPVYNDRGEVVGIVTAKYAEAGVEGLGFAIPINDVVDMIRDLVEVGYVTGKPSFGITAQTVSNVSASYYGVVAGAEVKAVNPDSAAEKAGVKVGDIITALDGKKVVSSDELIAAKSDYRPGDTVKLTVYRDGDYLDLTLTFDEDSGIKIEYPSVEPETPTQPPERDKLPTVPKDG